MAINDEIIAQRETSQPTPPDLNTDIFALLESLRVTHLNAVNQDASAIATLGAQSFTRRETENTDIETTTVTDIKNYLSTLATSKFIPDTYNGNDITTPTAGVTKINFNDYTTWKTQVDGAASCPLTNSGYNGGYRSGYMSSYRSGYMSSYDYSYRSGYYLSNRSGYNSSHQGSYNSSNRSSYNSGYRQCWGAYYSYIRGSCGSSGYRSSY